VSRARDDVRALRVGVVVLLAAVLFAAGIWTLGQSSRFWSPKVDYRVRFRSVEGLSRGSTVSVAGYTIGTVTDIRLPEDPSENVPEPARVDPPEKVLDRRPLVELTLSVERKNTRYIREDTRARQKTLGLLGDRYVDLTPGTPSSKELPAGALIQAVQPPNLEDILQQGESLADNLGTLIAKLSQIVDQVQSGEGILGALVTGTDEGRELIADLKGTAASIRSVADKLDQGTGVAGMLLNDERPAKDLKATLSTMRRVAGRLDSGDGLLPRLLSDDESATELLNNLQAAAEEMRTFTASLGDERGLLARLTADEELADDLVSDLRETASSFARLSRRIEEGEGSLGKLIQDETLYRGLNDILAGASKSVLTRWFVTRSQKSGAEERLESAPAPVQQ